MSTVLETKAAIGKLIQNEIATNSGSLFVELTDSISGMIVGVRDSNGSLHHFEVGVVQVPLPQAASQSKEAVGDQSRTTEGCCHSKGSCCEAKKADTAQEGSEAAEHQHRDENPDTEAPTA